MSTAAVALANPYVGPRSFRSDENLYGRDRDVQELLDLLIAERIVLLYSPSGAGKTSLLQAKLIPALERESFTVRPIMRVSRPYQELRPGAFNRYVLSALSDLEEVLPKQLQRSPAQLAGVSFEEYLAHVASASSRDDAEDSAASEVLIFDQFEEILTIDPADLETKREFFAQVGSALRDRGRWAVFSMREDYIAGLDPYLRLIPTRLRTTYRLDLLDERAARQAIQKPVQALRAGIEFTDSAAAKLVDNLRRIRVQRPDGSVDDQQLGPYVEPVQLQVVCRSLWERLPAGTTQIVDANVAEIGDVDTALADYYAQSINSVAGSEARERAIRQWVEDQLITEQGIRGQVLQGQGSSNGLDNAAIYGLVDAHLVRAEKRRGATWFELAHDRLIDPVKANNEEWFGAHLSKVQKTAALWAQQGQPEGLLLIGDDLVRAKQWEADSESSPIDVERKFLRASEAKQEAIWREKRQTKRLRWALGIATLLAALACLTAVFAIIEMQRAHRSAVALVSAINAAIANLDAAKSAKAAADLETSLAKASQKQADGQAWAALQAKRLAETETARAKADEQRLGDLVNQFTTRGFSVFGQPAQPVAGSHSVDRFFVLASDGNLWLEQAPFGKVPPTRRQVEANVFAFQELNPDTVLVLVTDGSLWLERAPFGKVPQTKQKVDANLLAFQGLDPDTILVLGPDRNLWLEQAPFGRVPRHQVDSKVLTFQGLDPDTVLVLKADGNLWLQHAPFGEVPPTRQQVDASVLAFQGLGHDTVFVLGTDGNLWLERAPFGMIPPIRQQVDGYVLAFQGLDPYTVVVLGTDGNLWLEHEPFGRVPPPRLHLDGSVRAFRWLGGQNQALLVLGNDGKLWLENIVPPGRTQIDLDVK